MDYKNIPEGYTQIVKAIEWGLKGETEKMKWYVEQYIKRYPEGAYINPFKHFITGEPQSGLMLLDDMPTCKHKWIRTTKNYKPAWRCFECKELVTEKPKK